MKKIFKNNNINILKENKKSNIKRNYLKFNKNVKNYAIILN